MDPGAWLLSGLLSPTEKQFPVALEGVRGEVLLEVAYWFLEETHSKNIGTTLIDFVFNKLNKLFT